MKNNNLLRILKITSPSKIIIFIAIVLALISTVSSLVVPQLTKDIIDGSMANFTLSKGIIVITIFLIQGISGGATYFALSYIGNKMVAKLREMLWKRIIYLPIPFFSSTMSGETASRVVNDTNIIKTLVSENIVNFVIGIITLVASIVILFVMDWKMTMIILLTIPVATAIVVPLGKIMYDVSIKTQNKTADFTGSITQALTEMRLVKSSNGEGEEIKRETSLINDLFRFGLKEAKINAILDPLITGIVMIALFGIIAYGGMRVTNGTLSSGTLIAFILYIFNIVIPIASFGTFITQVQKAKGATARIIEILDEPIEDLENGDNIDLTNKKVSFNNVSFNYNDENDILKNISFSANPNETIAFVGPSGAGKSTIFSLIERFYSAESGQILLDDKNINEISLKSWRSQIGYVPQESSMFSASIRENLCYGLDREVSDDELWEVVELAYVKDVIENLPEKFDSHVGERGLKLSGGERQRLAIARAFLRDPKILLLDEATASLDSQSEGVVQEALANLMKGRTTFVIAHRLSTIVNAHQIVFVENGEVTGIGKHDELVNNHNLYAEFAKQQLA
ncbi:ATP-binding cassette subfamily B protein AbcA/BmrA [Bacilli bacterium PM5-9]|nr:ATP-binding cassette subfamily B protein AbcA/BmrA [Bacilli bacterium PM5-9]